MITRRQLIVGASGATLFAPPTITYAGTQTGKELAFLLDCSISIMTDSNSAFNKRNSEIQKVGHIKALLDPQNMHSLTKNKVYVRVIGWARGARPIFDGAFMKEASDIQNVVDHIKNSKMLTSGLFPSTTHHYSGVQFALDLPRAADQLTIDLSTDEKILHPAESKEVRDEANRVGAKINALSIGLSTEEAASLKEHLVNGFVLPIRDWSYYIGGIQMKLEREIA